MNTLQVTITFVALYAITVAFFLTGWVGLYRGKTGILRGDGGDPILHKRIRIYGNLTENAPIFAMAIGSAEYLGLAQIWLWAAFASFIAGRLLHFILFDKMSRGAAMMLTQFPSGFLGIWTLYSLWLQ